MRRGQVFVRARDETGKLGSADVLDLDDLSFRALIVEILVRTQLVTGLREDLCEGERIALKTKRGIRFEEDDHG